MCKWLLLFFILPGIALAHSGNEFSGNNARQQASIPQIDIRLINSTNDFDEIKIRFQENADINYDEADSIDSENALIDISAYSADDMALSVNTIPKYLVRLNIPVEVDSENLGHHRLEWGLSDMLNYQVILKDNYLDELIDLDTVVGYDFDISSEPLTSGKDRFLLAITQKVHFTVKSQSANDGHRIEVPVSVLNFNEILTAQFAVKWDVQTLSFQKVDQFAINSMSAAHFNIDTTGGNLIFAWDDSGLNPQTLTDHDTLFSLHLMVSGTHGQLGEIDFDDKLIVPEVAGSDFKAISTQFNDGQIDVLSIKNIRGQVTDLDELPIPGLSVITDGDTVIQTTTDNDGYFEFELLKHHFPQIKVQGNPDSSKLIAGINSEDILRIKRHLLKIKEFDNEFLSKGADIDRSGIIDSVDISLLRQLILGENVNLPSTEIWQYYSNQNYSTSIKVSDTLTSYEFTAVKLGDLDNSWHVSEFDTGDRKMILQIGNQKALEKAELKIPVTVKEFNQIAAFQFTIAWDPTVLEYQGMEQVAVEVHLNESLVANGHLPVQWNSADAQDLNLPEGATLFYLKFTTIGSIGNTSYLEINDQITEKQAVNNQLQDVNITTGTSAMINIVEEIVSSVDEIPIISRVSNYPNPFQAYTSMKFSLKKSNHLMISIMNSQWKIFKQIHGYYRAGDHELVLDTDDWPSGIYYLHMKIDGQGQAVKLVKKP